METLTEELAPLLQSANWTIQHTHSQIRSELELSDSRTEIDDVGKNEGNDEFPSTTQALLQYHDQM